MKKLMWVWCVSVIAVTSMANAENRKPSIVRSEKIQARAIVEDIDYDKREITVRGAKGRRVLKVGDEARNLDQVKKGDEIVATIYESVAYSVVKKGEAPDPSAEDVVHRSEKGEKPGGVALASRQVSAKVEAINPNTRELTLKGPEGNIFTVNVDERVGDLRRIKKGDEVVATYTEAVAISVMKPNQ